MQKEQIKRPYFPPEITTVEFRVERGMQASPNQVELGVQGTLIEEMMYFSALQQGHNGSRMGGQMSSGNYFGFGDFIPNPDGGDYSGPSGASYFGGGAGGYF